MNWMKELIESHYPKPSEDTKGKLLLLHVKITELLYIIDSLGEGELLDLARRKLYEANALIEHHLRSKR